MGHEDTQRNIILCCENRRNGNLNTKAWLFFVFLRGPWWIALCYCYILRNSSLQPQTEIGEG